MATCMFSLGALGAWQPKTKKDLVDHIGTGSFFSTCNDPIIGPAPHNEPISDWDVSKVTDMSEVFKDCKNFNVDISGWETSQVTDFSYVFRGATTFNQPLVSWNTEKALYFNQMFRDATAFNQPLGSWNTGKARSFHWMFKDTSVTSVSIKTTAYWDTTTAGFSIWKQLSQQPCPDGYVPNGGANYGTVAVRCPGGCNVLGYYPDANGFCRNDCFVDHCEDCTTDRETTCDTCTGGYAQYAGSAACVEIKVCSTATGGQCLVCKNVNECEAGQCNPGYQFDAQCPAVAETYYTTAGDCTITQNCPSLGDNEEYVTGVVLTSPTECKKCSSPGIGQKFISPSPSPGACETECADGYALTNNVCTFITCTWGSELKNGACTPCVPEMYTEKYYTSEGSCGVQDCTSARPGEEYYQPGVHRSPYCPKQSCTKKLAEGERFKLSDTKGKCATECIDGYALTDNVCTKPENPEEKKTKSEAEDNTGMIVGIIIGAVVLLIILAIVLWWFCCYRRRKRSDLPKANLVMLQDEVPDADFNVTAAIDTEMPLPNYSEKGI